MKNKSVYFTMQINRIKTLTMQDLARRKFSHPKVLFERCAQASCRPV